MIQLFALHSAFGLMTTAAALDRGLLGDADQRILVPTNTAAVPETAVDLVAVPRFASLRRRFGRIEPLNPLVDPRHPTRWEPDEQDLPMLERLFRRAWGIGDAEIDLFVQSPQVAPALTLMSLFPEARLNVIGDGLMTYSPIRDRLPRRITERVRSVVYPDLVPGVVPLVFAESGAAPVAVPADAFGTVLREVGDAEPDPDLDALAATPTRTAVVIGQYLAALGLLSEDEETAMQRRMVDVAADTGADRVVFKPHPAAPPARTSALAAVAERRGVGFATYSGDQPAEYVAHHLGATDAVAGFSTALPALRTLFGVRIHSVGSQTVLARLSPFENSNRVPAVIVHAMTSGAYDDPVRMQRLIDTVGYAMQPRIVEHLRPRAEAFLDSLAPGERERLVPAERRRALALPGAPAPTRRQRLLESSGGVDRLEELRLTAAGAKRRAERVWKAMRGR